MGRFFQGATAFLACHLAGAARCGEIPISLHVAQSGGFAGIRNTLFTTWLPKGEAFAGLSGRITLAGNAEGFSEALVEVGGTPGDRAACAARNTTVVAGMPVIGRFWAGILKSNGTPVGIPVAFSLPSPVPSPDGEGLCLTTLVSAGYPYLRRDKPLYTTVDVALRVATAQRAAQVTAFGIGGEFKFAAGPAAALSTYVGIRAERRLRLEGIAASVSAAPISGAPPQSGWGPPVRGAWQVATDFVILPQALCSAGNYAGHRANADVSVLRLGTPRAITLPTGGLTVLRVPLAGSGMQAVQSTPWQPFDRSAVLEAGDCLIAFEGSAPGGTVGEIDVENQSTAYLVR